MPTRLAFFASLLLAHSAHAQQASTSETRATSQPHPSTPPPRNAANGTTRAANRATPSQSTPLQPIEQGVEDVNPLAISHWVTPVDLRSPIAFEHVYRVNTSPAGTPPWAQTAPMYARSSGALTAIFPRSSYIPTEQGAQAEIPAGTVWVLGDPKAVIDARANGAGLSTPSLTGPGATSQLRQPNAPFFAGNPPPISLAANTSARDQLTQPRADGSTLAPHPAGADPMPTIPLVGPANMPGSSINNSLTANSSTGGALLPNELQPGRMSSPPRRPTALTLWNSETVRQQRLADLLAGATGDGQNGDR